MKKKWCPGVSPFIRIKWVFTYLHVATQLEPPMVHLTCNTNVALLRSWDPYMQWVTAVWCPWDVGWWWYWYWYQFYHIATTTRLWIWTITTWNSLIQVATRLICLDTCDPEIKEKTKRWLPLLGMENNL